MKKLIILLTVVTIGVGLSQYGTIRDRRRSCPRLYLTNGRVRNKPRIFAQFSCSSGYLLMGERYMKCTDGKWDGKLPVCVKPSCKKPQSLNFGTFFQSYNGAVLTFFCIPNYVLHGPNFTYCDGKSWSGSLPACVHENSNVSVSCDFENADLCGWSHSLNHDFTWERINLKTPSGHVGTGPKFDHTKGEGESGYYMYIESSYRNENDTATLISPLHQKQPQKRTCLEFYYHMYGSGIGQLKLFVKFINQAGYSFAWNQIFEVSGNQGDVWHRGFVDLGDLYDDFQIIFQGIRGINYISDIAIDDVKLIEDCTIEELTTATTEIIDTSTVAFESCENRCFKSNETSTLPPSINSCDCDENCQDRNSCCPDFGVYCISEYTTDNVEDDETTSSSVITTTFKPNTTQNLIVESTTWGFTKKSTIITTKSTFTPKLVYSTFSSRFTSPSTSSSSTSTSSTSTLSTLTLSTSTSSTSLSTFSPISSSTSYSTKSAKTFKYIDDIASFPTTQKSDVKEFEIVPEEKSKLSITKPDNTFTVKVVIVCTAGIFVVLILIFAARKISVVRCLKMKRMRSSNGDSQSDVRFLTGDEVLDFTLATPSGSRNY